ncbi:MAG: nuclear transport factor 2 family protein [Pseudomonadota bacterium]
MSIYLNEVLAQRNFDRIPEIAAPGMIDHTQPASTGPAALDAHARGFCANTPDVEIEVVKIFADDETAVGLWKWHGEPSQPSAESAKGSPVVPRFVCSIFEFKDGQIQDYRVFVDAVDVFTQLAQ